MKKFLAIILCISILSFGLGATANTDECAITVATVKAETTATTADVTVKIDNNPGIAGILLKLSYDNDLKLTGITRGNAVSGLAFTLPGTFSNPCNLLWDGQDSDNTDGTLVTLSFELPTNASGSYEVNITYNDGDIYDDNLDNISPTVINGKIVVGSPAREVSGEMLGAQLRTEGVPGLRFATKINVNDKFMTSLTGGDTYDTLGAKFADGVSDVTFGTLAIPLFVLEDNSFKAENLTHALAGDMDIADVICKNVYDYDASSFTYTAVVTEIPEIFAEGKIVARGYVKYTENGKTVYHYFDPVCVAPSVAVADAWTK